MCGITAYIGRYEAFKYILEGLIILQNRGYDSAGITTLDHSTQEFITTKFANDFGKTNSLEKIKDKFEKHSGNKIGIGHTRWATHGAKCDINAHPHLDSKQKLALVHNGIIENYLELKKFLIEKGFVFLSETDTEVIANLISYYLDKTPNPESAIEKACQQLQGTWGLSILFKDDPEHVYVSRNGSPILVGYNEDMTIIASESSAFVNSVNKYIIVKDHDILKIGGDSQHRFLTYDVKKVDHQTLIHLTPDPYSHWMLKEIMEQPNSILRTLNMGGRIQDNYQVRLGGLDNHSEELLAVKHLLIIAMGTSYHSSLLGSKFFKLLKSVDSVTVIDASEFTLEDIPYPHENVGALFLSQSGETRDVHLAIEIAKKNNIFTFAIVNTVDSLIAREVECGVYLNAGREVAVASTKSFTSQVLVLILIAIWYAQHKNRSKNLRGQLIQEIHNLSYNFQQVLESLSNKSHNNHINLASFVQYLKHNKEEVGLEKIFLLGRQGGHAVALEGALKVKEVSYLHAEGYPGGALKHGPFALIETGVPIILLAYQDEWQQKIHITAQEVKTRGAKIYLITDLEDKDIPNELYDLVIKISHSRYLAPLLSILPLQYLSYQLTLALNYNPDYPRNLAKCVTTE